MSELDPRKQTILRAIVIEYIGLAEPVGSEAIIQKYELGVKSATVRNEMAEMSDMGLLEQPHTSSGRIPSDKGYRYFVDRLIMGTDLEDGPKQKLQSATTEGDALNEMLRETARSLSRLTHLLSVAATLQEQKTLVKTAVLSALDQSKAIFVLVLSNGHIENRMVELPLGVTLEDVGAINESLVSLIVGQTLRSVSKSKTPGMGRSQGAEKLCGSLWSMLRSIAKGLTRGKLIAEGEEFMLAQPEFSKDITALNQLLDNLAQSDMVYEAVASEPIQKVTIGSENKAEAFRKLSVIRQSFYVGTTEAGIIALVGPTRLNYEAGIPLVNFTAQALTDSLSKFFG